MLLLPCSLPLHGDAYQGWEEIHYHSRSLAISIIIVVIALVFLPQLNIPSIAVAIATFLAMIIYSYLSSLLLLYLLLPLSLPSIPVIFYLPILLLRNFLPLGFLLLLLLPLFHCHSGLYHHFVIHYHVPLPILAVYNGKVDDGNNAGIPTSIRLPLSPLLLLPMILISIVICHYCHCHLFPLL